jgi:hypothetical protein
VLYEDGTTVSQVAENAEFGLGQPQRSWLRGFFDEHEDEVKRIETAEMQKYVLGEQDFDTACERIALWIQGGIQRRIRNRISPANAEVTIKAKGSDVPLIDHGVFRSAILSYYNGRRVT